MYPKETALTALIWLAFTALVWAQAPVVGENVIHVVQAGENLYTVSHDYQLGLEHVALANRLPLKLELKTGLQLVIPLRRVLPNHPPANGMVLNIPERGIFLFQNGKFVKFYPVAIGRLDFKTPRGNFKVISKVKDPTWVPPAWAGLGNIAIGPGPDNPLGDRWIGLSATRIGIHGTQSPYSIGAAVSHGCLRMYPEMARELYERVRVGMSIRIEYETARVGRLPTTGGLFLVTFPDVYGFSDPVNRARRLLRAAGGPTELAATGAGQGLATELGTSTPLTGEILVRRDGHSIALADSPIEEAGRLWIPAELLTHLALNVYIDEGADWGAVSGPDRRIEFRVGEAAEGLLQARRFGRKLYFLGPPLLDGFDLRYRWQKPTLELL